MFAVEEQRDFAFGKLARPVCDFLDLRFGDAVGHDGHGGDAEVVEVDDVVEAFDDDQAVVLDEVAVAKALREKWIGGAALDVYEKEPLPADSPLRDPAIEDRCRLMPQSGRAAKT